MRRPKNRLPYKQFLLTFTARDRLVLCDLMEVGRLRSVADVIRLALQNLARHYDMDDGQCFELRRRPDPTPHRRVR